MLLSSHLSDAFHVFLGIVSVLLGVDIPMTIIFCFYQYLDHTAGEPAKDTEKDMIEYGFGLVMGAVIRWTLAFIT